MDFKDLKGIDLGDMLSQTRYGDQDLFQHDDLTKRIRRTLYYDPLKKPDMDTLSFSVTKSAVSCFRNAAPMPIGKLGHRYASRVARDACISPCALLLGLIYIERLKHKNPSYLEKVSSSDLFLISMMVASKYLYDEGSEDEVFNDEWAVSGETEVEKVNKLEADFLSAIDWHLYVHPHEFSSMLNIAETDIALSNGCKRGWLTYSDLRSLLDCHSVYKQLYQTAGMLSKATCMCMIMYSGLVCLAAFSSAALVSVTHLTSCGSGAMGPHIHASGIENASDTSSSGSEMNPTAQIIDESHVSEVLEPNFVRDSKIKPQSLPNNSSADGNWDKVELSPMSTASTQPMSTENNFFLDGSGPESPPSVMPSHQRQSNSVLTILEAAILMAHIPTVCPSKPIDRKDVCCLAPQYANRTDRCSASTPRFHKSSDPPAIQTKPLPWFADFNSNYGNKFRSRNDLPWHVGRTFEELTLPVPSARFFDAGNMVAVVH